MGFRCGFLGLLHLEIITQRLEREFDVNLITTTPGVIYKLYKKDGKIIDLQNPTNMPDPTQILKIEEPWINATIITPDEYLGSIIKICQDKEVYKNLTYSGKRAVLSYELPLNEVVFDFYDRLKSISSGYASFDYEITEHKEGELVKLGILVNNEPVDALAMIIHREFAQKTGRLVCEKLKELIPRHNFMIPIQAAIGGKIVARETIKGFKKDVLTKIHGGGALDRKRKLLEKQKKGKAKAKQFGKVEIPQEAFIGVLKINKEKLMRELTIITNENIYSDNENFYCDNLDIKTLSEGLSNQFKVHLIGRSSKVHRSHKINIQNISVFKSLFEYLNGVNKLSTRERSNLIVSITPFTFCAVLTSFFKKNQKFI